MSKERPILFQGAMVRALLDGSKTQTRRAFSARMINLMDVAAQAGEVSYFIENGALGPNDHTYVADFCPYGKPGDRLWVRETWAQNWNQLSDDRMDRSYVYRASGDERAQDNGTELPWRPSIHMPRAASRVLLEIVSVRVERLNDCSDEDARAEGCPCYVCGGKLDGRSEDDCHCFHRKADASDYRNLWESINGPDSWSANPWVWVVEFRRLTP